MVNVRPQPDAVISSDAADVYFPPIAVTRPISPGAPAERLDLAENGLAACGRGRSETDVQWHAQTSM